MSADRPARASYFALLLVLAGCGDGGGGGNGMSVEVGRQSCTASCTQGMKLQVLAYRAPSPFSPCLLESYSVNLNEGRGVLDDLPLVEGETIFLAAIGACLESSSCEVCWDAKQVRVTAGGQHQLTLKDTANCTVPDTTLVLVTKLPRFCE